MFSALRCLVPSDILILYASTITTNSTFGCITYTVAFFLYLIIQILTTSKKIIEGDPFYEPDSEDSDEDSAAIESANRANKLMKEVRRRKGLPVDDHIVVHAEKQRTLNKKK